MATNLTADERAAMRAYLQRSEVRLSTVHRTATALLSGAGVLVLLPTVGRDSIVNVLQPLLSTSESVLDLTLAALVIVTFALSILVIWMLLMELTRFYFHSNHFEGPRGSTFTPRFTLTSLHLPFDELSADGSAELRARRDDRANIELLVPSNDKARRRIDAQVAAYEGLAGPEAASDVSRRDALLQLAGVRDRTLIDEVAKVEYGMARHVLRIQAIVLRYVKALFVVIVTMISTVGMAAAVESSRTLDTSAERWIAAALVLWAPAVLFVSKSPVRWLGQLLMSEGAASSGIRYDRELTRLEQIVAVFSLVVLVGATVCGIDLATKHGSTAGIVSLIAAVVVGCALEAWQLLGARR